MDNNKSRLSSRKWAVDFSEPTSSSHSRDVSDPPGFSRASTDSDESAVGRQRTEMDMSWKQQKAWEVAQAPFKNLFMMGFMMWMAGSTVHLFSIGITISALLQPISALKSVGKVFEPFQDARTSMLPQKLAFVCLNMAGLLLGLWKLNSLGLLPTHASDWVSSLLPPPMAEISGGGIPFY